MLHVGDRVHRIIAVQVMECVETTLPDDIVNPPSGTVVTVLLEHIDMPGMGAINPKKAK